MNLGQVLGVVVATQKEDSLRSSILYVVQPQDETGRNVGEAVVAADTVGSKVGDQILWVSSREAALAMPETFTPVDAAIVGIVDRVEV
ncbi:MAG: EutN/CcmL family microcompartment protein [Deltaproteobacteria bacterium]|nr:EutN/CcmL family microcompartment protein [Deltaproteobacteria bacterium]